MTSVVDKTATWGTMPGWGIFADLLPPELVASRQLRKLQKRLLALIVAVLVLCAGGYVYAMLQHSSASSALSKAKATSQAIQAQQGNYAAVTQIRTANTGIQAQIAQAMAGDVDFAKFVRQIRAALPPTMSITSTTITLNAAGAAPANGSNATLSGATNIGTVSIAGGGQAIPDLAVFVTSLSAVPGVVDVVPSSNVLLGNGTTSYTLTFGITDQLLSHRYDGKAGN